jgi:SAM-dependent methyltransferase
MADRPCIPGEDLRGLWRALLPGTPFPVCGTPELSNAVAEVLNPTSLETSLSELERWETRYAVPDYAFGKEPNHFLASCKALLPGSGKALAVADGEGRNGVWLAEQGLDVVSIDFSPSAQKKARALARERGVQVDFRQVDVHAWDYPADAFDVVVEIFTQFSSPAERAAKWAGMRRALKSGGLLIVHGYTPKQLDYGTGGPKELANLYTRPMLEEAFGDFREVTFVEEEREIHEGTSHGGMSAMIGLTARKP